MDRGEYRGLQVNNTGYRAVEVGRGEYGGGEGGKGRRLTDATTDS